MTFARRKLTRTPFVATAFALTVLCTCSSAELRLRYSTLESPAMGRPMEFAIYQPADWTPDERLPLVIFLHGGGDGVDCFDRADVGQALDAWLAERRIPRSIIAVAEGELGFWENWADGSRMYRDWVLRDLLPHVRECYRTLGCPDGCHLVGISMGGYGALRFALLEPGAFASVTAISAPILDTDAMLGVANSRLLRIVVPVGRIWGSGDDRTGVERDDLYLRWARPDDLGGLRLMIAWGEGDRRRVRESNERFRAHLEERGVPHVAYVFPGGHTWSAWRPALEQVLRVQLSR